MKVFEFKNVRTGQTFGIKEDQPDTVKRLKKDKEEYELVNEYDHEKENSVEEQGEENNKGTDGQNEGTDAEPLMFEGMTPDEMKEAFTVPEMKAEAKRRGIDFNSNANQDKMIELLLADAQDDE